MSSKIILTLLTSLSLVVSNATTGSVVTINPENGFAYRFENAFDEDLVTIEAWININEDLGGGEGGVIIGNYYNTMFNYGDDFNLEVTSEGYIQLNYYYYSGSWPVSVNSYTFNGSTSNKVNTGTDTHIAVTRTTSSISLYLNGSLVETGTLVSSFTNHSTMAFQVGVDYKNWTSYPKAHLRGSVKQLSLFSEVLTDEEISSDYSNKTASFTKAERSSTVGSWYFGDTWSDQTVYDTSENGNNAILINFETWIDVEEATDFDYTLVVFPDVQTSVHYHPELYYQQVQWVIDNKETYNIPMVNYVGDLVDNPTGASTTESEWAAVQTGFQMYQDAGVTWGFTMGNHDYDGSGSTARETTGLDSHISFEEYSSQKYFAGCFEEGSFENQYFAFEVDGIKYLYLNMEFGPRPQVLRWVERLMDQYYDHRVIIFTHSFVNTAGNLDSTSDHYAPSNYGYSKNTETTNADEVWANYLSKHENLFLIFSGHESSDDIKMKTLIGDNGNVVRAFLVDAQGIFNSSGVDMLFMLKINESKQKAYCYWYSPSMGKYLNLQNQFSFSFGEGETSSEIIGYADINELEVVDDTSSSILTMILLVAAPICLITICVVVMKARPKHEKE